MQSELHRIALSLGSNLGNRCAYLRAAVVEIERHIGSIIAKSDIFETPAWGIEDQPRFLNACLLVETTHAPHDVLASLKEIERSLGRVERERWGRREIDIDILMYDDMMMDADGLTIPHRQMTERAFALVPLAQIAPDMQHPADGSTIAALLARLGGDMLNGIVTITSL